MIQTRKLMKALAAGMILASAPAQAEIYDFTFSFPESSYGPPCARTNCYPMG